MAHEQTRIVPIIIPGFKGGQITSEFDPLQKQTYQRGNNLDPYIDSTVLMPTFAIVNRSFNANLDKVFNLIQNSDSFFYLGENSSTVVGEIYDSGNVLVFSFSNVSYSEEWDIFDGDFVIGDSTDLKTVTTGGVATTRGVINTVLRRVRTHLGLGKVFFAHGIAAVSERIGSWDSATFTASVLTFKAGERVVSMEAYGRFLVIGIRSPQKSRIVIWNGSASVEEDSIELGDTELQGLRIVKGRIVAVTLSGVNGLKKLRIFEVVLGGVADVAFEYDLQETTGGGISIEDKAIDSDGRKLSFGLTVGINTFDRDIGVFSYGFDTDDNRIFNFQKVVSSDAVSGQINISSLKYIEGGIRITWNDGTTHRINHVDVVQTLSSQGVYESNIFPLNGGLIGKIKRIYINHKPLPASCGFTASIKHFGNYPSGGTVLAEDSFTDLQTNEGSGGASGKTQSTNNTQFTEVAGSDTDGNLAFDTARYGQLRISFDEINVKDSAQIIFPIILDVEIGISRP